MSILTSHSLTISRLSSPVLSAPDIKATMTTESLVANSNLAYTAKLEGALGNSISVRYVDPAGNNKSLSVTVSSYAITVNLATDSGGLITSTATQIKSAIQAKAEANALVTVAFADGEDGTGVVEAMGVTLLTGGVNAQPKGYYSGGTTTTFTAVGNLQPASRNDTLKVPEGIRDRKMWLFITKTQIVDNDKTTIDGDNYKAMVFEPFIGNTTVGRYEVIFIKERGQAL